MNKLIEKLKKMEEKIEDTIFDMNLEPSHEGWAVCWEDEDGEEIASTSANSLLQAFDEAKEAEEEIASLFIWKDLTTVLGAERTIVVNVVSGKTKAKLVGSRTLKSIKQHTAIPP